MIKYEIAMMPYLVCLALSKEKTYYFNEARIFSSRLTQLITTAMKKEVTKPVEIDMQGRFGLKTDIK